VTTVLGQMQLVKIEPPRQWESVQRHACPEFVKVPCVKEGDDFDDLRLSHLEIPRIGVVIGPADSWSHYHKSAEDGGMARVAYSLIEIDRGIEGTACSDKFVDGLPVGFILRCIKAPSAIFEECGRGLRSESVGPVQFSSALVPREGLRGMALYAAPPSKRSFGAVRLVLRL
jgi:hypothetical protein